MPEEISPPVKPTSSGSRAARGIKTGPPIDQNSKTLSAFAPVVPDPHAVAPPAETHPAAGDATFQLPPPGEGLPAGAQATIEQRPAPPRGNIEPTLTVTASETQGVAGPTDVTLAAHPDGVTLIAPPFEGSLGSSATNATLNSMPHDATLGGVDGATAAFHQKALEAAPKALTKGASFGHYELLEPIAKGGMGIVYKARQRNLNRIVAIKMILAGQFADQDDINRFYAEAEAAAALSHPNIVAIHEIGEVSGQHFFSMDFIEGQSLSGLIQENPVPPRRAAEFMITIAETMQFAHESGVVHRDLKPANVLLDKRQRPLITDFGLAKQVSNTSQMTMAGSIVGTPSYMPPEQAAGKLEEIGPWSDLYSLGAILYELLTGRPPFRAASPFETIRQVLETEPPSPRLLNPNVPKDLETICLKCLQKARTNRYTTAQELADELKRFLRGEPIHARPISQVARFWRLCKRYPLTSSAIAAAVLLLVAIPIITTGAYLRISAALSRETAALSQEKAAKGEALRNFRKARQTINDLFTIVSENTLFNQPGAQTVRKELLDKARSSYEDLSRGSQNNPELAVDLADAHFRLGKVGILLGSLDDATKPLLEARRIQGNLLAAKPSDFELLKALSDTLTELGQVYVRKKDYDAANRVYDEAARIRGRLAAADPGNMEYLRLQASAHMNAGLAAYNLAQASGEDSDFEAKALEAHHQYDDAQTIRIQILTSDATNLKVRRDLAKGYFNLGNLASAEGDAEEAIGHYQKAAEAFEQVLAEDPKDLENQGYLTTCYRLVGDLSWSVNKAAEARAWYEKARAKLDSLVSQNPDVPEYQREEAGVLLNLFQVEKKEANNTAATTALQRAQAIFASLANKYPSVADYRHDLAITLRELAKEQAASDEKAAAINLKEAIRLLSELKQQFPNEVDYAEELEETQAVSLTATPTSISQPN